MKLLSHTYVNIILSAVLSFVISFLILEEVVRYKNNIPLFETKNFIFTMYDYFTREKEDVFDPITGWGKKEYIDHGIGFMTGHYGLRMNGDKFVEPKKHGILISGDSFSFGSGVLNTQSTSAVLEKRLGIPVLNSGSGSFGLDQAILRAEDLKNKLDPIAIVIDMDQSGFEVVRRVRYAGANKPYFTVQDGQLVRHNDPVPLFVADIKNLGFWRSILGHSYLFVWSSVRFNKEQWIGAKEEIDHIGEQSDYISTSCLLLKQLKSQSRGLTVALVIRYFGNTIDQPPSNFGAPQIAACARNFGYVVTDSHDVFRAIFQSNPAEFKSLYIMDLPTQFGHMSVKGNALMAQLIYDSLAPKLKEKGVNIRSDP